jgi:DNA polymerase-3 subunit alpha
LGRATTRARGRLAERAQRTFGNRFYIEVQRNGMPGCEAHLRAAVLLASELRLPVVATHGVQFLGPDDHTAHDARVCVAEGEMLANPKRVKRFSREQYFKTQAQMEALFADLPSALANSVEIAKRCNLGLVLGKPQLPDFATPRVGDAPVPMAEYFRNRLARGPRGPPRPALPRPGGARARAPALRRPGSTSRSRRS